MALPSSKDKALRNALADHLGARCREIEPSLSPSFSWRQTRNAIAKSIAPGDDPQGTVILPEAKPALSGASFQLVAHERLVVLQLVVADADEEDCQDLACDWQGAIATSKNSIMNLLKLSGINSSGLNNAFKGITFLTSRINLELGQDGGAIATLVMRYKFTDVGG